MPDRPPITRRRFLALAANTSLAGAAVTTGVVTYTCLIEPHWIEVVERPLPIAGLPPTLIGKTLIHISDLHIGPTVDDGYMAAALRKVSRLEPDLVAITGDFMTCRGREQVDRVMKVMAGWRPARLASLAVLGNHDYGRYWRDTAVAAELSRKLGDLGVRVLRNEMMQVDGLKIVGLDDLWGPRFDLSPAAAIGADEPALALCHNPDACDRPGWGAFRGWVLSGHTHGGQCKPPFLPPPLLPVANRRYTSGAFDLHDGRHLYINRGLGYLRHARINARPEITRFTLKRA